jgi:hypothetical protein
VRLVISVDVPEPLAARSSSERIVDFAGVRYQGTLDLRLTFSIAFHY